MSDADPGSSLYDYAGRNPPEVTLRDLLRHPNDRTSVIGHIGFDGPRDEFAALFPREREEHYYRKFDGYAISEKILREVRARGVSSIYIIEQDNDHQFLEFDPADFYTSSLCVAYSTELDTVVEGEDAVRAADDTTFADRQRIVPEIQARTTWNREDCVVNER